MSAGARYDITTRRLRQVSSRACSQVSLKDEQPTSGRAADRSLDASSPARPGPERPQRLLCRKDHFKPAAPDLRVLTAEILSPERTTSEEVGVKIATFSTNQLSFDMSFFHMTSTTSWFRSSGRTETPSSSTRERSCSKAPSFSSTTTLASCRTSRSSRATPTTTRCTRSLPSSIRMRARRMRPASVWSSRPATSGTSGLSYWPADGNRRLVRHPAPEPPAVRQDQHRLHSVLLRVRPRPLLHDRHRPLSVVGRNLGDSRHYVAESEIGDAQDYVAFPRRFWGEVAFRF